MLLGVTVDTPLCTRPHPLPPRRHQHSGTADTRLSDPSYYCAPVHFPLLIWLFLKCLMLLNTVKSINKPAVK